MRRLLLGLAATVLVLTACGTDEPAAAPAAPAKSVPDVELNDLLLSVDDVNTIMDATGMVPQPLETEMNDNRNLLPNLNCLGVWQPNEASIYGVHGEAWSAMRRQVLRAPDVEDWDVLALQSVVSYTTPDGARKFFDESTARWSQCTNHKVNIKLNDKQLPKWLSGALEQTDNRLTMPISRGTDAAARSCQRVLAVQSNVVIDTMTCAPQTYDVDQATLITDRIEAAISAA